MVHCRNNMDVLSLGLRIETPFPSLADVFWLAGYAPLTYHLYRIYTTVTMKVTIEIR